MNVPEPISEILRSLLAAQRFAVLATSGDDQPHASLVAFVTTPDLRYIVFVTERDTRKYIQLIANPRVALLIDSRTNRAADPEAATAVTVSGLAAEVSGDDRAQLIALYSARHPYLADCARAPTSAMMRVTVATYRVVSRFQEVHEWHPA